MFKCFCILIIYSEKKEPNVIFFIVNVMNLLKMKIFLTHGRQNRRQNGRRHRLDITFSVEYITAAIKDKNLLLPFL